MIKCLKFAEWVPTSHLSMCSSHMLADIDWGCTARMPRDKFHFLKRIRISKYFVIIEAVVEYLLGGCTTSNLLRYCPGNSWYYQMFWAQLFKTNDVVSSRIVKILIIKYVIYANIFAENNVSSFCICKSYSHFFSKNTCELDFVFTRTANIITTNEFVKLTTLWTNGPWISSFMWLSG